MTQGIDVSKWNAEPLDYSGVAFVIVQTSHWGSNDTPVLHQERLAPEHVAAARKAHVPVMGYHFVERGDGVAQARAAYDIAQRLGVANMPFAIDAEVPGILQDTKDCIAECKRLFPQPVGLYSYVSWVAAAGGGLLGADWGWVAHPGTFELPSGWWDAKTLIWQFGNLNGCDGNRWRGTQAEFDAFMGGGPDVSAEVDDIVLGWQNARDGKVRDPDGSWTHYRKQAYDMYVQVAGLPAPVPGPKGDKGDKGDPGPAGSSVAPGTTITSVTQ